MPENEEELQSSGGRPIWSGTVTFGLVSVPVNIMPANRSQTVALHMVSPEGHQLARRYVRAKDEKELDRSSIVRGYEISKGKFVVLDEDELERLAPERTRDIDLRIFVDAEEIDPIYFERAYYLTPNGVPKAYRLLAKVMEDTGKAGIATFVMRAKEYLVAILAENGILRAETLRFADEIRTPEDIGLPRPARVKPADVKKLETMIKRLTKTTFDKRELIDKTDDRLEALAKKKSKAGEDVIAAPAPAETEEQGNVLDLMAALQRSLNASEGGGSSRRGRSAGKTTRKRAAKRRAKKTA